MACKVSQWLRLSPGYAKQPKPPGVAAGGLKRVKFNSNMPQYGWGEIGRCSGWGSVVEFELELATCNWQRSEVRSSAHKKSIKSEAFASSPVAIAAALSFCVHPSVGTFVRRAARLSVESVDSIYAPPSQLELELECMRVLASAFSRINSESCAKRTRQDTRETGSDRVGGEGEREL